MSVAVPERVLVVGSGSIAQRHVRNLLTLGVGEQTGGAGLPVHHGVEAVVGSRATRFARAVIAALW